MSGKYISVTDFCFKWVVEKSVDQYRNFMNDWTTYAHIK
jgi:hypothetical protein